MIPAQPNIPFYRPAPVGTELGYLERALESRHLTGDGPFGCKCAELLESVCGVPKVLLTPSCTHALEMSALLLDIEPGDEVIVPAFAFVSTANAFVMRGAKPRFVDIRPDTLNLDETLVEAVIMNRTRAIVALHYGGVACDMNRLQEIARESSLAIVEDNAHGLFARYEDDCLGAIGDLGVVSFHGTKLFSSGEGGALLVNRPEWIDRAEILREKGTDRSRFSRGEIDRYTWVDLGSSYLPSELQAAHLYAQLEARDEILKECRRIWKRYREGLAAWAERSGVGIPSEPQPRASNCSVFYLLLRDTASRDACIAHLDGKGIRAAFHYLPLHLSRMGRGFGGAHGDCPVTESVSERLLRLPLYFGLTASEQERVIDAVLGF